LCGNRFKRHSVDVRERRQIVQLWRKEPASALVTLVRVQGSSYRQPGARLLLSRTGKYAGTISGGCLEADVLRRSSWLTRNGAALERYSTLLDEAGEIPFGLGCGGIVDVLLEPSQTPECRALLGALESSLSGREVLAATWLPRSNRQLVRALFAANGELIFASDRLDTEKALEVRAKYLREPGAYLPGMFVERLSPPQRLFVFGAGDDAKPLVSMASLLGWNVTVVDGRTHLARQERFPDAEVVTANSSATIPQLQAQDVTVVMTHSYQQDRDYLSSILPLHPRYVGLLGSRRRSSLLIAEVATTLGRSITECCELISAPIGLDIGGEGPEAIALAIIAEAQACCMGKHTDRRRLSAEEVKSCLCDDSSKTFLHTQCGLSLV
jgi:xanthine dehydrogenase accessory factor